jgi:hypothetical protein
MNDIDDRFLDRLRRIAERVDDPPELVDASAHAALATRRLDDELARLVADSDAAESVGAVRNGGSRIRLLTFQSPAVTVELQVDEVAQRRALRGQISGTVAEVVVETASDARPVTVDERGRFAVDDLPAEAVRVRLRATDGTTVTTGWIS